MKRFLTAGCLLLLILAASIAAQVFLIGDPVDGNTVTMDVTEDGNIVYIHIMTVDSAMAYCGERRHREGSTLSITLRKVLVSPVHDSGYHIAAVDTNGLSKILVGGRQVWPTE